MPSTCKDLFFLDCSSCNSKPTSSSKRRGAGLARIDKVKEVRKFKYDGDNELSVFETISSSEITSSILSNCSRRSLILVRCSTMFSLSCISSLSSCFFKNCILASFFDENMDCKISHALCEVLQE